jgi:hypothetical protein
LHLQELLTFLEQQPPSANTFQVLVEYRVAEQQTTVLYDTFTEIHS